MGSIQEPLSFDDLLRPLPEVKTFDRKNATVQEIVDALIITGGCVIKNVVSTEALATIEKDTRPFIEKDGVYDGALFPSQTRRVTGLAGKSKAFIENIPRDTLYQQVCDVMLSSSVSWWLGSKRQTATSKPQLNNTIVFSIAPGARDQGLHRDNPIHHTVIKQTRAEDYKIGQEDAIGFFVAGKKTTRRNGATRFIPGSHLWGPETIPDDKLAHYAALEPGDAFMMLSSCYHGGSANSSTDEERLVYSCFMVKGFLRQEENQFVANSWEKIKDMYDLDTLRMLGYGISDPYLGWVDFKGPLEALGMGEDSLESYRTTK